MEAEPIQVIEESRVILRAEAKLIGLTRYFTGKPCKHGHIAKRLTLNGSCVVCAYDTWKRTVGCTPKRKAYEANRVRDPLKVRPIKAAWKKRNPHKGAADSMRRRAAKFHACPWWVDRYEIERIYLECARVTASSGIEHHVDHIVPILGRRVCGLHVPWNLRIITGSENQRKGNQLLPELLSADGHIPVQPRQADLFGGVAA